MDKTEKLQNSIQEDISTIVDKLQEMAEMWRKFKAQIPDGDDDSLERVADIAKTFSTKMQIDFPYHFMATIMVSGVFVKMED